VTESSREAALTGGCQCGALRYALYVVPKKGVHLCHCRMCQKAVGGPFAALAPVSLEDFAWTRGEPGTFASSSVALRDFCANCGTPLTFRYRDSGRINVTVGSLDRPQDVPPELHFGIEGRIAWLDGIAGLPTESTENHMTADRQAKLVNHQHPDHETADDWTPRSAGS